jgi:hypothetical protein
MVQDLGVCAASIFQGVTKNWKIGEIVLVIDRFGKDLHRAGEPRGIEANRAEGVANDIAEQHGLRPALGLAARLKLCPYASQHPHGVTGLQSCSLRGLPGLAVNCGLCRLGCARGRRRPGHWYIPLLADSVQFPGVGPAVRVPFADFHSVPAEIVGEQVPNSPAAGAGK